MSRMATTRGHDSEYWYTLLALLFLTGALVPLLYDLGGTHVENYSDSNPLRLGLAAFLYVVAAWLLLRSPRGAVVGLLQQNPLIIVVLLLPLLSLLWSVEPQTTFRRAVACALTVVFCAYLALRLSPEELLKRLMFVFFLGGVASILYAVLLPEYGIHHDPTNPGSWKGVYGHKNDLGRTCALALIVAYFVRPSNQAERWYRILTLTIFFFLLVMSQSRTNWLIVMGMVGFIPLLGVLRSKRLTISLRVFLVVTFAIACAFAVSIGAEQLLFAVGRDDSFSGRQTLWRGIWEVASKDYPVLGAGYGSFFSDRGGVLQLEPYLVYWGARPNHAHNGYLNVFADLGAVGLLTLILFLVATSVHLLRRVVAEPHRPVWSALSVLMFLFLLNNVSESVAFRHSDIAWALVLVVSFYARAPVRQGVQRASATRLLGLRNGNVSVWPIAAAVRGNARKT